MICSMRRTGRTVTPHLSKTPGTSFIVILVNLDRPCPFPRANFSTTSIISSAVRHPPPSAPAVPSSRSVPSYLHPPEPTRLLSSGTPNKGQRTPRIGTAPTGKGLSSKRSATSAATSASGRSASGLPPIAPKSSRKPPALRVETSSHNASTPKKSGTKRKPGAASPRALQLLGESSKSLEKDDINRQHKEKKLAIEDEKLAIEKEYKDETNSMTDELPPAVVALKRFQKQIEKGGGSWEDVADSAEYLAAAEMAEEEEEDDETSIAPSDDDAHQHQQHQHLERSSSLNNQNQDHENSHTSGTPNKGQRTPRIGTAPTGKGLSSKRSATSAATSASGRSASGLPPIAPKSSRKPPALRVETSSHNASTPKKSGTKRKPGAASPRALQLLGESSKSLEKDDINRQHKEKKLAIEDEKLAIEKEFKDETNSMTDELPPAVVALKRFQKQIEKGGGSWEDVADSAEYLAAAEMAEEEEEDDETSIAPSDDDDGLRDEDMPEVPIKSEVPTDIVGGGANAEKFELSAPEDDAKPAAASSENSGAAERLKDATNKPEVSIKSEDIDGGGEEQGTTGKSKSGFDDTKSVSPKKGKSFKSLSQTIEGIIGGNPAVQAECTTHLRSLLSEKNPPIQQVIDSGVVPCLLQSLIRYDNSTLQFEAAWALSKIASGTSNHTNVLVKGGAISVLCGLLVSPVFIDVRVRVQVVSALGHIAASGSPTFREQILQHGAMEKLIEQLVKLDQTSSLSMIRAMIWTVSKLCEGRPHPEFDRVKTCLVTMASLLDNSDDKVVADACWALSYLSDGGCSEKIQAVIEAGVCGKVVEHLGHPSPAVQTPALRTVGNIVAGDDRQTQFIINNNALPCLLTLLSSSNERTKKEACWAIANITAGNKEQIQAVIDNNVIPALIQLLANAPFDVKKEALWAISNATSGTPDQVKFLVDQGCIGPLCNLLTVNDAKIVTIALEGLENILKVGDDEAKQTGAHNRWQPLSTRPGGLPRSKSCSSIPTMTSTRSASRSSRRTLASRMRRSPSMSMSWGTVRCSKC